MCIKNLFLDYEISKLRGGLEVSGQCFSSRVSVRQWTYFSVWRPFGLPQPVEGLLLASSRAKVRILLKRHAVHRTSRNKESSSPKPVVLLFINPLLGHYL